MKIYICRDNYLRNADGSSYFTHLSLDTVNPQGMVEYRHPRIGQWFILPDGKKEKIMELSADKSASATSYAWWIFNGKRYYPYILLKSNKLEGNKITLLKVRRV